MIRWLLLLLLIPSVCFGDSELTIGGKTAQAHIIQVSGDSLRPRPYLDFEGCTGQDLNGKTVITCAGGGGSGGVNSGTANQVAYYATTGTSVSGNSDLIFTGSNVGVGSVAPQSKFYINGGGIGGELVNKGWELVLPNPSGVTGGNSEVDWMTNFEGNMYVGFDSGSFIYKWDGNNYSQFYQVSPYLSQVVPLIPYNGKLYAGTTGGNVGNGSVYVYDPNATPVNFVQMVNNTASVMTIPNDSTNNALFGSTSYSVEFYGRIDAINTFGTIISKENTADTTGFTLQLANSNNVYVSIDDSGGRKTSHTVNNAFTVGSYHDIIFSWTSGSAPVIYVDGVSISLATSTIATTPANDTSNILNLGNDIQATNRFGGTFRRLRLWRNYAVTSGDASTLAAGGTIGTSPTGQYLFTEGSGTTTADSSGNGNTATIVSPAYWSNTLFDLAYSSGTDKFIYALGVFKGCLYAGAGFSTSNIYQYCGSSWSKVFSGVANNGLVVDLYNYKGLLFAAMQAGGSGHGAIYSTPDGITWTQENLNGTAGGDGYTHFVEFRGKLYVGYFGSTDAPYVRNDATGTWSSINAATQGTQSWGLAVYNNALYIGTTEGAGTGSKIYKSYDGQNYTLDFQVPYAAQGSTIPTENFYLYPFNGSLYAGFGFLGTQTGDIWRKTDSLGQQSDWWGNFINKFRGYQYSGVNWSNDSSLISVTSPFSFDSNVGIGSTSPGRSLDIQGTARMTGFLMPTGAVTGYALESDSNGNGTWTSVSGSGTVNSGTNTQATYYNINGTTVSGTSDLIFSGSNLGVGSALPGTILDVQGTVRSTQMLDTGVTANSMVGINGQQQFVPVTLTTTGSSGASTYTGSTNTLNIPQYSSGGGSGTVNSGTSGQSSYYSATGTSVSGTNDLQFNGSNVGIGSSNPGEQLDVQGTVRALFYYGNGSALTGISGSGTVNSGTTGQNAYYASAGTTLSGTNDLQFNGSNVGVGSATPGTVLDVQGTVRSTNFIATGQVSIGTTVQNGPSNGLYVVGNIGINSITPGAALDVQGTVRIPGANGLVIGAASGTHLIDAGSTDQFQVASNGNVTENALVLTNHITQIDGSSSSTLSKSILQFLNGGTTATIVNNAANSATGMIYEGSNATNGFIELRTTSGIGSGDYTKVTGGNNGATEIARFLGSGNVGIGSASPGAILDVQGTVRASGDFIDNDISVAPAGTLVCVKSNGGLGVCASLVGVVCSSCS